MKSKQTTDYSSYTVDELLKALSIHSYNNHHELKQIITEAQQRELDDMNKVEFLFADLIHDIYQYDLETAFIKLGQISKIHEMSSDNTSRLFSLYSVIYRLTNDVDQSYHFAQKSEVVAETKFRKFYSVISQGMALFTYGFYEKALETFRRALRIVEHVDSVKYRDWVLFLIDYSELYVADHNLKDKIEYTKVIVNGSEINNLFDLWKVYYLAHLKIEIGDIDSALLLANEGLKFLNKASIKLGYCKFKFLQLDAHIVSKDTSKIQETLKKLIIEQDVFIYKKPDLLNRLVRIKDLKLISANGLRNIQGEILTNANLGINSFPHGIRFLDKTESQTSIQIKLEYDNRVTEMISNYIGIRNHNTNSSLMSAHFLSNALNSIQFFVLNTQKELASDYLAKYSRVLRQMMRLSKSQETTLDKELEFIKSYLDLEAIRVGFAFSLQCSLREALIPTYHVPVFMIQPYIENAVKHAVKDITGMIHVNVRPGLEGLFVHIQDNGPGFTSSTFSADKSTGGMGMQLNQERMELYNAHTHWSIALRIFSSKKGSHIVLHFKP